jgi:hypothetical protein
MKREARPLLDRREIYHPENPADFLGQRAQSQSASGLKREFMPPPWRCSRLKITFSLGQSHSALGEKFCERLPVMRVPPFG